MRFLKKLQEEASSKRKLDNILLQAEDIISASNICTGRNHPIFSFVASITRKCFYDELFNLNCNKKSKYSVSHFLTDIGCESREYTPEFRELENPIVINLDCDPVCSFPWEPFRFISVLAHIGKTVENPFKFDPNNHSACVVIPLGLTVMNNGYHSSSCGIIKSEGIINTNMLYDMALNYELYYFDGTYIRKSQNKEVVVTPQKFECGVLFEIGRIILNHKINFIDGENVTEVKKIPSKPKDTQWRISLRENKQILHYFCSSFEGECEVEVIGNAIVFTTTSESYGPSVENEIETLSKWMAQTYNIPLCEVVSIEHFQSNLSYSSQEIIRLVIFSIKENELVPAWKNITLSEFNAIVEQKLLE